MTGTTNRTTKATKVQSYKNFTKFPLLYGSQTDFAHNTDANYENKFEPLLPSSEANNWPSEPPFIKSPLDVAAAIKVDVELTAVLISKKSPLFDDKSAATSTAEVLHDSSSDGLKITYSNGYKFRGTKKFANTLQKSGNFPYKTKVSSNLGEKPCARLLVAKVRFLEPRKGPTIVASTYGRKTPDDDH
uniref:Uncharacterized protein n=1 Tax=Romanomermis culicivorax TaxID=13658 RepID=A0A915IJ99_ROMCU